MKPFHALTAAENEDLERFPVYISLLAATGGGEFSENARTEAVRFAHTKTFSCDPLLIPFYQEVDKDFEQNLILADERLPNEKNARIQVIKEELEKIQGIVNKLGEPYAGTLRKSMESFKEHVSRAHNNVLADFIFPMPLPGMNI